LPRESKIWRAWTSIIKLILYNLVYKLHSVKGTLLLLPSKYTNQIKIC